MGTSGWNISLDRSFSFRPIDPPSFTRNITRHTSPPNWKLTRECFGERYRAVLRMPKQDEDLLTYTATSPFLFSAVCWDFLSVVLCSARSHTPEEKMGRKA